MIHPALIGIWIPLDQDEHPGASVEFAARSLRTHNFSHTLFDRVWDVSSCVYSRHNTSLTIIASATLLDEDISLTIQNPSLPIIDCHIKGLDVAPWSLHIAMERMAIRHSGA